MKIYNIHSDPGHAWLEVERQELEQLGILTSISPFSYQKDNKVFLEEDCDLARFYYAKGWDKLGKSWQNHLNRVYHRDEAPIRRMESFQP